MLIPPVHDTIGYSRIYDLHTLVGDEYTITKPTNIVSKYFPSPNLNLLTNMTYYLETETNTFNLSIQNINYTFLLSDNKTKQIILPILLLSTT